MPQLSPTEMLDIIMTVETKGIPIAYATAAYLEHSCRHRAPGQQSDRRLAVSINYVSGHKADSDDVVCSQSIKEEANVLIIDDFMKAGGTIQGMMDLLQEFRATVKGRRRFCRIRILNGEEQLIRIMFH